MTYRELLEKLTNMTDFQLDCDITVEDSCESECFAATLRIADTEHDSLDNNHPIIFF